MNLPEAIEVEKKLLSALMLREGECIPDVSEILRPNDFFRPEHRLIYESILRLYTKGTAPDVLLIEEDWKATQEKRVPLSYLYSLIDMEWTTARALDYATIIKQKSQRRQLMEIGSHLIEAAKDDLTEPNETIGHAEDELLKLNNQSATKSTPLISILSDTFSRLAERVEKGGRLVGLSTGFKDLDVLTSGLKNSDLIILAARPSMGKTALALNIAVTASLEVPTLLFSLEMSKDQLGQRLISQASGIDGMRIATGDLSDSDMTNLIDKVRRLEKCQLEIDDTGRLTLSELRLRSRRHKQKHELGLIIIDYIQLMQGTKEYKGNRVQEVSEISRGLKALARELNVPILALSQLSRSVEQRADKRPLLSDLRESGSIEQDADIVMFLYRESYYEETEPADLAEVIVSKNRNGATGKARLRFKREYCHFEDYEG